MNTYKSILVTGGAGFIGSHLVRRLLKNYPNSKIVNLDALTYAGNLDNLKDCERLTNYNFIKGDIKDFKNLQRLFKAFDFDAVIHLAAESHDVARNERVRHHTTSHYYYYYTPAVGADPPALHR